MKEDKECEPDKDIKKKLTITQLAASSTVNISKLRPTKRTKSHFDTEPSTQDLILTALNPPFNLPESQAKDITVKIGHKQTRTPQRGGDSLFYSSPKRIPSQ